MVFMDKENEIQPGNLRVGAASVEIEADDNMVIGGGIFPVFKSGQEGRLRASAVVMEKGNRVCIVSCDALILQRDILDNVCRQIESETGILFGNINISATHTHHAPTTVTLHGYERDELFCKRVMEAIVKAVITANSELEPAQCSFRCGIQSKVGQNSRVKLDDGTILWVPLEEKFASSEPTGLHDPEFPVLSFELKDSGRNVILFNHNCHNIGSRDGDKRSPGFYGLAAQELEKEYGGLVVFLSGASGSSHDLKLTADELIGNIKGSVTDAISIAVKEDISDIGSIKTEFNYRIRTFNEQQEDQAVSHYCNKIRVDWCDNPEDIVNVFRKMRKALAKHQGEWRKSWLQVILVGKVAYVAVPGELFGTLALDIKSRSPFDNTYIIGYANDHIGYISDKDSFQLGGYQIWTGYHSLVEKGTGESMVESILSLLNKMKSSKKL